MVIELENTKLHVEKEFFDKYVLNCKEALQLSEEIIFYMTYCHFKR